MRSLGLLHYLVDRRLQSSLGGFGLNQFVHARRLLSRWRPNVAISYSPSTVSAARVADK
jgi:hypothetical protein